MKVRKTYEVYSYDVESMGDPLNVEETGVEYEGRMTPEDFAQEVHGWECSRYPLPKPEDYPHAGGIWFRETYPQQSREYFEKGHERYDSLHILQCTRREWERLLSLLNGSKPMR